MNVLSSSWISSGQVQHFTARGNLIIRPISKRLPHSICRGRLCCPPVIYGQSTGGLVWVNAIRRKRRSKDPSFSLSSHRQPSDGSSLVQRLWRWANTEPLPGVERAAGIDRLIVHVFVSRHLTTPLLSFKWINPLTSTCDSFLHCTWIWGSVYDPHRCPPALGLPVAATAAFFANRSHISLSCYVEKILQGALVNNSTTDNLK